MGRIPLGKTMATISEKDWRYLRSVQAEMLDELSRRINDEVRRVLVSADFTENEKRGKIYEVVTRRDRIVADCFDGWSRSRIIEHCWILRKHGLLKAEHLAKLDPQTQKAIMPFD